ncbi:MAG: PIN domain-containing protein [Bacillota bacterium]
MTRWPPDLATHEGQAVVVLPLKIALPDPDDLMFLEVAVGTGVDAIVTGNKKHFPAGCYSGIPVVSPAELLSLL